MKIFKSLLLVALVSQISLAQAKPVVVFIPGSGSSGDRLNSYGVASILGLLNMDQFFRKFQNGIKEEGVDSFVCPKTPDKDVRSIEERQEECAEMIAAHTSCHDESREIIIFGHSMGGLIARMLANDSRVAHCIKSVTTLSTPHKGTVLADFAFDHYYNGGSWNAYKWLVVILGFNPKNKRYLLQMKSDHSNLPSSLFVAQRALRNQNIDYYSFSTSFKRTLTFPLYISRNLITKELKKRGLDNNEWGSLSDGVIPTYSQIFGKHLKHFNSSHWEAVCPDPLRFTAGCKRSYPHIVKHLIEVAR